MQSRNTSLRKIFDQDKNKIVQSIYLWKIRIVYLFINQGFQMDDCFLIYSFQIIQNIQIISTLQTYQFRITVILKLRKETE